MIKFNSAFLLDIKKYEKNNFIQELNNILIENLLKKKLTDGITLFLR